ncbi:MAG: hypothetical protein Q7T11_05500 [Deltaproteobacteria bacterium]|nr:hypothetical protein [Deltaproteobacteria bacterium]
MAPPKTTPAKPGYWDHFIDPSIPLPDRVLAGAVLPIACIFSALPVACGDGGTSLDEPTDVSCNGDSKIIFKDGFLGAEDRALIENEIRKLEAPLRLLNPQLFCHFNGWKITDSEEIAAHTNDYTAAYYSQGEGMIHITPTLFRSAHELCHHVSREHSLQNEGLYASATPDWKAISCVENGFRDDQCIAHEDDSPNAEEEFANACGEAVSGPAGSIILHATNSNTLAQAMYVSKILGVSEATLEMILNEMLAPTKDVTALGTVNPPQFPESREGEWLRKESPYIPLSDGGMLFRYSDRFFIYVFQNENGDRISSFLPFPPALNLNEDFSADNSGDTLLVAQEGKIWSFGQEEWTLLQDTHLFTDGDIQFIDLVPTYLSLKKGTYVPLAPGQKNIQKMLPDAIRQKIDQAQTARLVHGGDNQFLWVSGLPDAHFGSKSELYRIQYRQGALDFSRVFDVPTISAWTQPIFYRGEWYLFETMARVEYFDEMRIITTQGGSVGDGSGPLLLRVSKEGRELEPTRVLLEKNPQDDFNAAMYTLTPWSLHVSGTEIVGTSNYVSPDQPGFLRRDPLVFQLGPVK